MIDKYRDKVCLFNKVYLFYNKFLFLVIIQIKISFKTVHVIDPTFGGFVGVRDERDPLALKIEVEVGDRGGRKYYHIPTFKFYPKLGIHQAQVTSLKVTKWENYTP